MKHLVECIALALTASVVWLGLSAAAALCRRWHDHRERQIAQEWVRQFSREEGRL